MRLNFKSTFQITRAERIIDANEIHTYFQTNFPAKIIEFWQYFEEVAFESGVIIYGFDVAKERNVLYEVSAYAPDYILIGDDGGGQGIFLKKNSGDLDVYYQDLGALSSSFYSLDIDLFSWLENNPTIGEEDCDPDELDGIKVYVLSRPNSTNTFIVAVRKYLHLNCSINDIREKLEDVPFLLAKDIPLMRYRETINELNQKYNCLEVRNAKNEVLIRPVKRRRVNCKSGYV
ncbi:hypothetical protein [Solibacillus sp. FSL K6-1523]|uniref:hypothetical protein n=1 Tax=Solibacillus sp. FSL K6-1523 TaxID=2921471 RepID=UPI0030FCAC9F